jgi:hypothetical protein
MSKTPILFTFFNRPEHLKELFKVVSKRTDIDPYFACDGPRNVGENELVEKCWESVEKYFPNTPAIKKLQRSQNLGCKLAMVGNLDWFFSENLFGLILEDDCIPNNDFFKYVGNALEEYKDHTNLMSVSGTDCLPKHLNSSSKLFRESMFPLIWGWGTWANKWQHYRLEINDHREIVEDASEEIYGSKNTLEKVFFKNIFNMRFGEVNKGLIDTWDYSLIASTWRMKFKVLQVNANLVTNRGFGSQATHTKSKPPTWVPKNYLKPENFSNDLENYNEIFDQWMSTNVYNCTSFEYFKNNLKKIIRYEN